MAKMDLSGITKIFEKVMKAIDDIAEGKDGEAVLKAIKQDFEQLSKDQEAKIAKAQERSDTLKKLIKASHDLTFAINETSKQARKIESAIGVHTKKLEAWEHKPKRTKLTAIKIDELKETIAREEESLVSLEKTNSNNEIQLNQIRIEISKTSTPDNKNS